MICPFCTARSKYIIQGRANCETVHVDRDVLVHKAANLDKTEPKTCREHSHTFFTSRNRTSNKNILLICFYSHQTGIDCDKNKKRFKTSYTTITGVFTIYGNEGKHTISRTKPTPRNNPVPSIHTKIAKNSLERDSLHSLAAENQTRSPPSVLLTTFTTHTTV